MDIEQDLSPLSSFPYHHESWQPGEWMFLSKIQAGVYGVRWRAQSQSMGDSTNSDEEGGDGTARFAAYIYGMLQRWTLRYPADLTRFVFGPNGLPSVNQATGELVTEPDPRAGQVKPMTFDQVYLLGEDILTEACLALFVEKNKSLPKQEDELLPETKEGDLDPDSFRGAGARPPAAQKPRRVRSRKS